LRLTVRRVAQGISQKEGVMTKSIRSVLLAGASFVGLALAAPALAAYAPSLTIEQSSYKLGAATTVDDFVFARSTDDATAKLTIFGPKGYTANITQAAGTKIGAVLAIVKAKALGGALLPLAGDVVVANGADPAIVTASQRCTGRPANQSTWILNASLQGQAIQIPVFVNKLPAGPSVTEEVCLPSPDVPEASGGAKFGAQLVSADFSVKGVFTNATVKSSASNTYEWAGIFTPYVAGTATVNAAGTNEWRTYVGLPQSLSLKRVASKTGVRFAGVIAIPGLNLSTIRLHLYTGKKANPAPSVTSGGTGKLVTRTVKPKTNGKYTTSRPSVKVRTYFQMRFEGFATTCRPPSPTGLPVPCKGEDLAPMTSGQVRVLPPPKKKHR
jgi:hypothetical protein